MISTTAGTDLSTSFWSGVLHGAPIALPFPTDGVRGAGSRPSGGTTLVAIPALVATDARAMAAEIGVMPDFSLLVATGVACGRLAGRDDLLLGLAAPGPAGPVAVPVRVKLDDRGFAELAVALAAAASEALARAPVPWGELEGIDPEVRPYQVLFADRAEDALVRCHGGPGGVDLAIQPVAADELAVHYRTDAYSEATTRMIGEMIVRAVSEGTRRPSRPVIELRLADPSQPRGWSWGATPGAPEPDTTVPQLVARHAEAYPDDIATVDGTAMLTYAELLARAAGAAAALHARGAGPEQCVAICMDRSVNVPVAVLGVLLAGAAWVPVDPALPRERVEHMIADSGSLVVLTDRTSAPRWLPHALRLDLEDVAPESSHHVADVGPRSLAYIVYTSGTTGWPKGVAVEHGNLAALVREGVAMLDIKRGTRVLQHISLSFDPSMLELLGALTSGATLYHVGRIALVTPGGLEAFVRAHRLEAGMFTPTVLRLMRPDEVPSLTRFICGGERLSAELARAWAPKRRFFNVYGPSEGTVFSTSYPCTGDEQLPPPIGKPLPGREVVVIDRLGCVALRGEAGEICLGGLGLARGYWRRSQLTADRFTSIPGLEGRFYRTGDLGRMRANGMLEFLGRIDRQVKHHGVRIELEEIEHALVDLPGVTEAAVQLIDGRLVAHVGASEGAEPLALRAALADRLPAYMLPASIAVLAELPRTSNGKVAWTELSAASSLEVASPAGQAASLEELAMLRIWQDVLERKDIGVDDNFFDLGGDSLDAMAVITAAGEEGREITPVMLYANQTIATLVAALGGARST